MTLFFPTDTSNVKINASNSQVNVSVGDSMSITAGNSFSIGGGSSSSIKLGPSTNFSLGSAVNINLASTMSYTYGFSASYGSSSSVATVTNSQSAVNSYTIKAGIHTPTQQAFTIAKEKQVYAVLLATIVSMGAIALAVVGGLSSPMFVKDTDPKNPNAVPNDSADVARASCALALTTVSVFIVQWGLTYFLAKSSAFTPVTKLLLNSTGITATIQTPDAAAANLLLEAAKLPIIPSVETIMYASPLSDEPTLTHRVNEAPIAGSSPQLSEVFLKPDLICLNSTTQPGGVPTHDTQILLDSQQQAISLFSDSASPIKGGSIVIAKNTYITNPDGNTTLMSKSVAGGASLLELEQQDSATLSCSSNSGCSGVSLTPESAAIGLSLTGAYAAFNKTCATIVGASVKISGTNIDLGGAITILGSPSTPNTALNAVLGNIGLISANLSASELKVTALEAELAALKKSMSVVKVSAEVETDALETSAVAEGSSKS